MRRSSVTSSLLVLCGLLALLGLSCAKSHAATALYYCPMHPQVVSDKAGDCQICGMHLVQHEKVQAAQAAGKSYVCPMHPDVRSDSPGDCPVCGMHLVLKETPKQAGGGEAEGPEGLAAVTLSPEKRAQLGLTLGAVERRPLARKMRATARIAADETRVFPVIARADGYVDKLFIPYAGLSVKKGQDMVSVYSPSIQAAQQQFIGTTLTEGRRFPNQTTKPAAATDSNDRDDAFRERLKYWGFGDKQIERIQSTGKIENSLVVESPAFGTVTEKTAVLGLRVSPGDSLFVVTDLSRVWAQADVAEADVPYVKVGMAADVRLAALPGRIFQGRVKFFQPVLDPQTHTMKVVLDLPNPDLELKPGLLGEASLTVELGDRPALPADAVMRAGEKDYVFVDAGQDRLVPTAVTLGSRSGDYFEVLSGLKEGQKVVTSANFLVDSESSLRAALRSAGRADD